jgi:hypothetical protein
MKSRICTSSQRPTVCLPAAADARIVAQGWVDRTFAAVQLSDDATSAAGWHAAGAQWSREAAVLSALHRCRVWAPQSDRDGQTSAHRPALAGRAAIMRSDTQKPAPPLAA